MHVASDRSHLILCLPADAASVSSARRELAELAANAGASQQKLDDVRLTVSEALSNVVSHAYAGGPGRIHVTAAVLDGELVIVIADDGCGLGAARESHGLGLGMRLMAQFSDHLTFVARPAGGVEVRLRFNLGPRADRFQPAQAHPLRGSLRSAERPASSVFSTTT